MIDPLPAEAAIERIRVCRDMNKVVLGIEGFQMVGGGYVPRTDLILDLSDATLSVSDAAAKVEAYVNAHGNDDVVFDITA